MENGEVKPSRSLANGKELVLHRTKAPSIAAEASIYSATYHCDAVCMSRCVVRKLPIYQFSSLIVENKKLSSIW
ncbi:MAG: hypothetical protein GY761_15505 [Hyphomicrobiales bacterium]|nr:hypothetical protein [Hyphomicrobiales bacterium]